MCFRTGRSVLCGRQAESWRQISIQVSAPDFSSVSASTYIPEKVGVELGDVKLEMKSSDGYNSITIDRVEAISMIILLRKIIIR